MRKFFQSWWPVLFLWIVVGGLALVHAPDKGQWLLGWDALAPEFNFELNVSRQLSAVWQGYRGLGNVDGMAQAADLTRTLFLWLMSVVIPTNYLRYSWVVVGWLLGTSGTYFLARQMWPKSDGLIGFVAGLFYLLNLATIQMFFTPFEPFVSWFGFLPWLLWAFLRVMNKPTAKRFVLFGLVSLLVGSAFVVQTLFLVYTALLAVMGIFLAGFDGKKWRTFLATGLIIMAIQAYWLLPVAYFAINHGGEVGQSYTNQLSTPETMELNKSRGSLLDTLTHQGYLLEYTDSGETGEVYLMAGWRDWLDRSLVKNSMYVLVGLALAGVWQATFRAKKYWLGGVYLLGLAMLATSSDIFVPIHAWLGKVFPLFDQLFRSSFTKWSLGFGLAAAVGLAGLIESLAGEIKRWISGLIVGLVILISWPVWQEGGFIYERMNVTIPNVYAEITNYLNADTQTGRLLTLPMHQPWGWNGYDWGYRGSGFLWYSIDRPMLDRAFDVWSMDNEKTYQALSLALYRRDLSEFERLVDIYKIRYLLLDGSVATSSENSKVLFLSETKEFLSKSKRMTVSKQWDELELYQVDEVSQVEGDYLEKLQFESPTMQDDDNIVLVAKNQMAGELVLPSFDQVEWPAKVEWNFDTEKTASVQLTIHIPVLYIDQKQVWMEETITNAVDFAAHEIPKYVYVGDSRFEIDPKTEGWQQLGVAPVRVNENIPIRLAKVLKVENNEIFTVLQASGDIRMNLKSEEIKEMVHEGDQILLELKSDFGSLVNLERKTAFNCDVFNRGVVEKMMVGSQSWYRASEGGVSCDYGIVTTMRGFEDLVVIAQSQTDLGRGLRLYVHNLTNGRTELEKNLAYSTKTFTTHLVSISDTKSDLAVNVDAKSFPGESAESRLESMYVLSLPNNFLNKFLVETRIANNSIYKNDESFESGWLAYLGTKQLQHVRVNGWANGWILPEGADRSKVKIIFWPQYLEWLGMGVSILTLVWIGRSYLKSR